MSELEILNNTQLSLIANGIYLLTFTGLIFITFRLIRYQRENNANTIGKVLVTIFGLCSVFYGYTVFSFFKKFTIISIIPSFCVKKVVRKFHLGQKLLLILWDIHRVMDFLFLILLNLLQYYL